MAQPLALKACVLDSNVLIDLADGKGFAHDLVSGCRHKKISLKVAPTVVQELVFLARSPNQTAAKRTLAGAALMKIREWGVAPIILGAVENGIALEFAKHILHLKLLPEEEMNDALILGETALAAVHCLVTSDSHLLDIPPKSLRAALEERHLSPITIYRAKHLSELVT